MASTKRGRPTAAARHVDEDFANYIASTNKDKTTRTQAAIFYRTAVSGPLSEAASEIPYLDGIFCIVEKDGVPGVKEKGEIIEQLGRMLEQDGFSESDVLTVAKIAAEAYHNGYTVKQIKAYILNGRKTGQW